MRGLTTHYNITVVTGRYMYIQLTEEAVGVVEAEVRGAGGGRKDEAEMTNSLALGSSLKFFTFIALYI